MCEQLLPLPVPRERVGVRMFFERVMRSISQGPSSPFGRLHPVEITLTPALSPSTGRGSNPPPLRTFFLASCSSRTAMNRRSRNHVRQIIGMPLEAQIANRIEHRVLVGFNGRQDRSANRKRNLLFSQRLDQFRRWWRSQRPRVRRGRIVKQRAIFRDDAIEKIAFVERGQKFLQFTAGHHDQLPIGAAKPMQGGNCGRFYFPVVSERAIVIRSQRQILHNVHPKLRQRARRKTAGDRAVRQCLPTVSHHRRSRHHSHRAEHVRAMDRPTRRCRRRAARNWPRTTALRQLDVRTANIDDQHVHRGDGKGGSRDRTTPKR
jgi:hypothetical protein